MGEFSPSHLLLIAIVLLIFFGPSRLPGLGQALGKTIRGFKEGLNDAAGPDQDKSTGPARKETREELPPTTAQGPTSTTAVAENTAQKSTKE